MKSKLKYENISHFKSCANLLNKIFAQAIRVFYRPPKQREQQKRQLQMPNVNNLMSRQCIVYTFVLFCCAERLKVLRCFDIQIHTIVGMTIAV